MEKLVVVFRAQFPDRIAYGWSWLKNEATAVEFVHEYLKKKHPESQPILLDAWTCDWRQAPSFYKLVFGTMPIPLTDLAGVIRANNLRRPGETKRERKERKREEKREKHEARLTKPENRKQGELAFNSVVSKPVIRVPVTKNPPFNYCSPQEAK